MSDNSELVVTVSRKLLLILALVGLVFLAAGLDIGFLHRVVSADVGADRPVVKWAFVAIGVLIGGLIAGNCLLYFVVPPVLLKVTSNEIVFGTGLRYRPYAISTRFLESIEAFDQVSMLKVGGRERIVDGGAKFLFRADPSIPSQLTTSMGAAYYNNLLKISSTYAHLSGPQIVEAARRITRK